MYFVNPYKALFGLSCPEAGLHLGGDLDQGPAARHLKQAFFAKTFHSFSN
jgi:hypothetical protein